MADMRPRAAEIVPVTVFRGWRPKWEKWVWDPDEEHWDSVSQELTPRAPTYQTLAEAAEAIALLRQSGIPEPDG